MDKEDKKKLDKSITNDKNQHLKIRDLAPIQTASTLCLRAKKHTTQRQKQHASSIILFFAVYRDYTVGEALRE